MNAGLQTVAMLAIGAASALAQAGPAEQAAAAAVAAPAVEPVRAFVEVDGLPAQAYVGQVVALTVRVGFDAAWFAAQSVPLTAQALDQPFHVVVPWLRRDDDARAEVAPPAAGVASERIAVGDRAERFVVAPDRTVDGRTFATRELRVRWQARRADAQAFAPVRLRYAFATAFVEDFLRGRQPRDRQEAAVASAALHCDIVDLPQSAPSGFTGAVGTLALAAAPAAAIGVVGQIAKVRVAVTGEGNLGDFVFAPAEPLPGFHVDGVVAGDVAGEFVLDVLPLRAGGRELPPLALVAFDPALRAYTTVRSGPAPLAIAPTAGALPPRVQELVAADAAAVAAAQPARTWPPLVAVAVALLVVGGARRRRRRAHRARVQAAIDALLAVPTADTQARHAAYARVLAVAAGLTTWNDDGWRILDGRARVTAVAALRTQLAALDAARYGGLAPTNDELAAALRAAF